MIRTPRRRVAGPVQHRTSDVFEPLAALLPPQDNIATLGDLATELLSV